MLTLLASALLVTVAALVGHRRYRDAVGALVDRLLADRRWFVGFAIVLVLVPVALVVAG